MTPDNGPMRRLRSAYMPALAISLLSMAAAPAAGQADPPRAVVIVVVDQLRFDQLDRYDELFTGGLRRLLDGGAVFTSAEQRHAVPHTAPGHATLATGSYPSSHGIVANSWISREERRSVYAVEDTMAPILGLPARAGRSPRNMRRPSLGTHLKRAMPSARVVAVAGKDRSAVTMGGHDADGAYWFDRGAGRFVTSAFYADAVPDWLAAFNGTGVADSLAGVPWRLMMDERVYRERAVDLRRGEELRFPKPAAGNRTTPERWAPTFAATPGLDSLTLVAATAAVAAHGIGVDEVPDLLWVGLSAADFIGHTYGPGSQETLDHLLHLDRMLGGFMAWLDERMPGGYQLVLSSDHGVMPAPERAAWSGIDAGRVAPGQVERVAAAALAEIAGEEGLEDGIPQALDILNLYFLLSDALPAERHAEVRSRVAAALDSMPNVAAAVTQDEIRDAGADDPMLQLYQRSTFPGRTPDIFVRPDLYWLVMGPETTAAHTTPYRYDLHVPLIFFGPPYAPARYGRDVQTVDMAPTLARILGFDAPTVDGRALPELAPAGR